MTTKITANQACWNYRAGVVSASQIGESTIHRSTAYNPPKKADWMSLNVGDSRDCLGGDEGF